MADTDAAAHLALLAHGRAVAKEASGDVEASVVNNLRAHAQSLSASLQQWRTGTASITVTSRTNSQNPRAYALPGESYSSHLHIVIVFLCGSHDVRLRRERERRPHIIITRHEAAAVPSGSRPSQFTFPLVC